MLNQLKNLSIDNSILSYSSSCQTTVPMNTIKGQNHTWGRLLKVREKGDIRRGIRDPKSSQVINIQLTISHSFTSLFYKLVPNVITKQHFTLIKELRLNYRTIAGPNR